MSQYEYNKSTHIILLLLYLYGTRAGKWYMRYMGLHGAQIQRDGTTKNLSEGAKDGE